MPAPVMHATYTIRSPPFPAITLPSSPATARPASWIQRPCGRSVVNVASPISHAIGTFDFPSTPSTLPAVARPPTIHTHSSRPVTTDVLRVYSAPHRQQQPVPTRPGVQVPLSSSPRHPRPPSSTIQMLAATAPDPTDTRNLHRPTHRLEYARAHASSTPLPRPRTPEPMPLTSTPHSIDAIRRPPAASRYDRPAGRPLRMPPAPNPHPSAAIQFSCAPPS